MEVERRVVLNWKLRGEFFVDIDPQARPLVGPIVSISKLGAAGKYVLLSLTERARLLNTEVRCRQVQMHVGRMTDR